MAKTLNDYLKTFENDYFNNAVDDVIGSSGTFTIGSTGKKPYEVSRYRSWDHCYIFFCDLRKKYSKPEDITEEDMNLACLNLAFYLASWGMYRGSGFILKYDYTIYKEIIRIIFKSDYEELWHLDDKLRDVCLAYKDDINEIVDTKSVDNSKKKLINELKEIAEKIYALGSDINNDLLQYKYPEKAIEDLKEEYRYKKDEKWVNKISISDTLITKIMLGTIGCMPGLDSNFKKGLGFTGNSFTIEKITNILLIAVIKLDTLLDKQNHIKSRKYQYPYMKLLDIYYFKRGAINALSKYIKNYGKAMAKAKEENNNLEVEDWYKNLNYDTKEKIADVIFGISDNIVDGFFEESEAKQIKKFVKTINGIIAKADDSQSKDEEIND